MSKRKPGSLSLFLSIRDFRRDPSGPVVRVLAAGSADTSDLARTLRRVAKSLAPEARR